MLVTVKVFEEVCLFVFFNYTFLDDTLVDIF